MRTKYFFIPILLIFVPVLLAACGETSAVPAVNPNSSQNQSVVTSITAGSANSSGLEAQTVEGGSVTVQVTPTAFRMGEPLEFDIAMNTHSVDLAADMLKAVVLRDDSGKEFTPTAWDGPAGGGHHREGKIKFAPLTTNTKSLRLVVKNIAGVPERVYKWDVAQ